MRDFAREATMCKDIAEAYLLYDSLDSFEDNGLYISFLNENGILMEYNYDEFLLEWLETLEEGQDDDSFEMDDIIDYIYSELIED